MADRTAQARRQGRAARAVERPALGLVEVVDLREADHQGLIRRAGDGRRSRSRSALRGVRALRAYGNGHGQRGIRLLAAAARRQGPVEVDHRAAPVAAVTQPAQCLQVADVVPQEPRLQIPGSSQIPQRQPHITSRVSAGLQVPVERGDPQGTARLPGATPALIQLLQGAVGELDRFRADGVEAHGADQEDRLLA